MGGGGKSPSPNELLISEVVLPDTRVPAIRLKPWPAGIAIQHSVEKLSAKLPSKPTEEEIVPVTSWVFNNKGKVTLISSQTHSTRFGAYSYVTSENVDARCFEARITESYIIFSYGCQL